MAEASVRLFSRFADPARVVRRLRELGFQVELDGPDASWRKATVVIPNAVRSSLAFVRESDDK